MVFKRRPHPTAPPRSPQQPSASRAGIPPPTATLIPSRTFHSLSPGTSPTVHGGLWAAARPRLSFSLHPACPILPEDHSMVSSSAQSTWPSVDLLPPPTPGVWPPPSLSLAHHTQHSAHPGQPGGQGAPFGAGTQSAGLGSLSQQPLTHLLLPSQGGFNYPQASQFQGPPPPSRKPSQPTAHPSSPGERAGGEAAQSRPRLQGSSPCSALPAACPQEP